MGFWGAVSLAVTGIHQKIIFGGGAESTLTYGRNEYLLDLSALQEIAFQALEGMEQLDPERKLPRLPGTWFRAGSLISPSAKRNIAGNQLPGCCLDLAG